MKAKILHLNLLTEAEKLSSSPVRPKVILPLVAGVALVATLGWWGFLALQEGMVDSEVAALRQTMAATDADYAQASKVKAELEKINSELAQVRGYWNARHAWGEALAAVALTAPEGLQLRLVEITPPPPQQLEPPPGIKRPPLLGPTNALEGATFRLAGQTAQEAHVFDFLDAIRANAELTGRLVFADREASAAEQSPKMREFGQAREVGASGSRAIVFDVEYRTPGRRFAP